MTNFAHQTCPVIPPALFTLSPEGSEAEGTLRLPLPLSPTKPVILTPRLRSSAAPLFVIPTRRARSCAACGGGITLQPRKFGL